MVRLEVCDYLVIAFRCLLSRPLRELGGLDPALVPPELAQPVAFVGPDTLGTLDLR
ncbi:MAG: hypothetical protein PHX83_14630 [Acidobacteriia bacterium]|nr:hypothetical protein [Terriglobia bacterium]